MLFNQSYGQLFPLLSIVMQLFYPFIPNFVLFPILLLVKGIQRGRQDLGELGEMKKNPRDISEILPNKLS